MPRGGGGCTWSKPLSLHLLKVTALHYLEFWGESLNFDTTRCTLSSISVVKLGFQYIRIYAWILGNSNHQHDIHVLNRKSTQIWWLANMGFEHSKLWLLLLLLSFDVFSPHKCTSLINMGQVVCPNMLKCQKLWHREHEIHFICYHKKNKKIHHKCECKLEQELSRVRHLLNQEHPIASQGHMLTSLSWTLTTTILPR